jgi:uncharacterized iron-regulated protein
VPYLTCFFDVTIPGLKIEVTVFLSLVVRSWVMPRFLLSIFFTVVSLLLSSCAFRSDHANIVERKNVDPNKAFWRAVEKADVIYVGETHNDPAHHEYERELIRGLLSRRIRFAVGWEMFEEPQQALLDRWQAKKISTDELFEKTDFQKHWAVYSPVYREILEITWKNRISNLALNAPSALARKIARGEPLTDEEQKSVPVGFVSDERGFQNFAAMMGGHPGVQEADLRRFFAAQNLWDQTIVTHVLGFKQRNPKVKLVVFAGRSHVSGGYGIPFYVKQSQELKQLVLLPRGRLHLTVDRKDI